MNADALGCVRRVADYAQDLVYAVIAWMQCGASGSKVKVNGISYEIVRLLGEGGFSMVYLVRDTQTGQEFALKKIRCQHGAESVREALAEVDAMTRFRNPNVIRLCDSAVLADTQGASTSLRGNVPVHDEEQGSVERIVYIVLPYYEHGNVQDAISAHVIRGTRFEERWMLQVFCDACLAVHAMHTYALPAVEMDAAKSDGASLLFDAVSELSYFPATPMATMQQTRADAHIEPYAHRDIKPANIMLGDHGRTGVLMDFGSTIRARVAIRSRKEAIAHQDLAAERSSMPYRAPELFDVKTDTVLDEKVDIWALGCTLYAMAYLHSPFETPSTEGGSLALAVTNGAYKFPEQDPYSAATRAIIQRCLTTDPAARPSIEEVIAMTTNALNTL
ncbi:non-specific serine/threonine protein kinase [Malassezia vespertilionis]|uniref:non-specific serine/threonine protein kinase n=1 Tax=Malassezia vespertilionis TaxID=2020962 RepID=A0A2N1JF65_9BASI|nr:non-specific serine/threonine protein kinase [Malassezia vespertilionis]PKI85189.1 hypothetical protein MVES_000975 [Malassezia vespertilionis]WFD05702.1 non-specific serine/threonine protein kinase [Malassezia vespertilionis]